MLYAPINASANGDNTLVAADTNGRRVVVVGFYLRAAAPVSVGIFSGPSSGNNTLFPSTTLNAAPDAINPAPQPPQLGTPAGQFVTQGGAALVLKLGAAIQVTGWLMYELIM